MANSDKDILITPNRGQSDDPKIEFTGATVGSSSTITMVAIAKSDTEGVLDISATDGDSIASFSEENTGSLFSVTDEKGAAKFEVNETGVVNTSLNSGALGLPVGTTSERPASPLAGFTRWNSSTSAMEIYTGNECVEIVTDNFPSGAIAFG